MAQASRSLDTADLAFAGIERQADAIRSGEVTSRELTELCLARIERLDADINSFRVVYAERALAEADQADARVRSGDERPLLGVPVAVKDDVDVGGEPTTYGTLAFTEPAGRDSEVLASLRSAGAVLIGKTNEPEIGQWPFTETLANGATRNPWALDRVPGGSSGGSGAAVAAGLVGVAVGSDGAGSIRIPAACCGIYGIKPSRGRIPVGKYDWHGLSTYGPLTRRVADAALFLDITSTGPLPRPGVSFREAASQPPPKLRIAFATNVPPGLFAPLNAECRRAVEDLAGVLRGLGHEVKERDVDYGMIGANVTARYLRGIHDDVRRADHPSRFERRTRSMARLGALYGRGLFERVRSVEDEAIARMNAIFDEVDVVLTPALARPPLPVGRFNGRGALATLLGVIAFTPYTGPWNSGGNPGAAIPMGLGSEGLPLAGQLVGRPGDEATLLSLSAQLEAELGWPDRRPPHA